MKQNKSTDRSYTRHSEGYKQEAVKLAERVGVAEAAQQLGLNESLLYQWRSKQQHQKTVSTREQEQASEIVRLRRELTMAQEEVAILKKASAYFARQLK